MGVAVARDGGRPSLFWGGKSEGNPAESATCEECAPLDKGGGAVEARQRRNGWHREGLAEGKEHYVHSMCTLCRHSHYTRGSRHAHYGPWSCPWPCTSRRAFPCQIRHIYTYTYTYIYSVYLTGSHRKPPTHELSPAWTLPLQILSSREVLGRGPANRARIHEESTPPWR